MEKKGEDLKRLSPSTNPPDTKDKFCDMIKEMEEEYTKPCDKDIKDCTKHKYHCAKCNTAVSYSPANYASRPQDIPNWCLKCQKDNTSPQIQKEMQ